MKSLYILQNVSTWRHNEKITSDVQIFTDEEEAYKKFDEYCKTWEGKKFVASETWSEDVDHTLPVEHGIAKQVRYERRNSLGRIDTAFVVLRGAVLFNYMMK